MEIIVTFPNLVIAIHILDLIKEYILISNVLFINRNLIHDNNNNNNKINLILKKKIVCIN